MQTEYINTIEDMLSDDYKKRMRAEYKQLCIRIKKLTEYIKKHIRNDSIIEIQLKEKQLTYMTEYKNVLEMRAALDDVDLS